MPLLPTLRGCPHAQLLGFSCLPFSTFIPNMCPQLTCLVLSLPVLYVSCITRLITQQYWGAALLPWVSAAPFTLALCPIVCVSTPLSSCTGMFGCPWCLQLQTTFLEHSHCLLEHREPFSRAGPLESQVTGQMFRFCLPAITAFLLHL